MAAITASLALAATSDRRLIQAVRNQDAQAVRELLEKHVEVNATQGDGSTALHWAVHLDDLAKADLLIRSGAQVDAANDVGVRPLHLACTNRSAAMVERLLAAGANPNAKLFNGETVLMRCARTGDARAVQALLAHGAEVNAKEPEHDQTALMWAAAQSHPETVGVLLAAGADLQARSRTYPQTVVDEDTQRAGREELNYTVMKGGSTALLFAARSGDAASARLLLAAGADSNDALSDGTSALVLAAHSGHTEVGLALLEKDANPNAMGNGYAPLHAAVLRSDLKLVQALLAYGANPNLRITKATPVRRDTMDFNLLAPLLGSTPYLLAARFVEAGIMRALRAGGADPSLTMPNGATPLMLAVGMGSSNRANRRGIAVIDFGKIEPESQVLEAVAAALEAGGDVNATNQAGDTALHSAAAQGYDTVIQFLADHGAQVNAKNKRGQTPLAALLAGNARGRGRAPFAVADPDSTGEILRAGASQSTVALLRRLGARE